MDGCAGSVGVKAILQPLSTHDSVDHRCGCSHGEAGFEAELDEAVEFGLNAEYPGLEELTTDVYGAAA